MTNKWNRQIGPAIVDVLSVESDGTGTIYGIAGEHPPNILSNLPPPALTAAEAALIEAVMTTQVPLHPFIMERRDAVLAERAPPDPVEVAVAAFFDCDGNNDVSIRAALKAFVTAGGGKS